jgi:hypothetical protein
MNDYDVKVPIIVFAGLLGIILIAAVILGSQALYYHYESGVETSEKFGEPEMKLQKVQSEQRLQLIEYRLLDSKKGIVAIPIEQAMKLVIAMLPHEKLDGAKTAKKSKGGFT